MKVYVGIDPGLDGAVALIWETGERIVYDTPTFKISRGKSQTRAYDVNGMAILLRPLIGQAGAIAVTPQAALEIVHSMPGQGVASMFKLGQGYGIWLGILAALGLPYTLVTPQAWKGKMMAGMGKEKDASRLRVTELFPELAPLIELKKHHGRADAILLAEYLRRESP